MKCENCPVKCGIHCEGENVPSICKDPKYTDILQEKCNGATPTIIQQMTNVMVSSLKYIAGGFHNVSDEEYEDRLKICKTCDRYNDGRCLECGCYLSIKARMSTEKCPLDKWGKIINNSNTVGCGGCKNG